MIDRNLARRESFHRPQPVGVVPVKVMLALATLVLCAGCRLLPMENKSASRRPEQSPAAINRSKSETPNEIELCMETARTVAQAGHAREAMLLYEKAERLSGTRLNRELAPLYVALGDSGKALERYQKALVDSPTDVELRNNFAWTLLEAGRVGESISVAESGLELAPQDQRLASTLAVAQYKSGNHSLAYELFRSAYGEAAAQHNLAMLAIDDGDEELAKAHLDRAVASSDHRQETEQLHRALQR